MRNAADDAALFFRPLAERVGEGKDYSQATLPRIGQVRSQKVQVDTSRPVRAEHIIAASTYHPRESFIGSRNGWLSYYGNFLLQLRYPELRLAKGVEMMFLHPLVSEKNSRADQEILKMTMYSDAPNLSEGKIAERRRIPGGVVICREGRPFCEPIRDSYVVAICPEIAGYVSPSTA